MGESVPGRRGWWHDDLTEGIPEPRQADANACRGGSGLADNGGAAYISEKRVHSAYMKPRKEKGLTDIYL
jgi:hypothetical protein